MDHQTIDAGNVAERYVTGRLTPEEAARFEEHYLDCPACCARVEAAERLQRGMRRLAEEAAEQVPVASPLARASRSPRFALALAAVLAIAILPAWFEQRQARRLEGELAGARTALARTAAENAGAGAGRLAAAEGQLQQARRDLAAEVSRREALAREVAAERRPRADLPVLPLAPTRASRGGGPVHTLTLPRQPGWVALWVEPGGEDLPAYRATLLDGRGKAVFQQSRLALNDLGALLLLVHSSSIPPGAYRLEVDGLPRAGGAVPVARFQLRVASGG
jgi:type II secretory pathway pseudopilin PulG